MPEGIHFNLARARVGCVRQQELVDPVHPGYDLLMLIMLQKLGCNTYGENFALASLLLSCIFWVGINIVDLISSHRILLPWVRWAHSNEAEIQFLGRPCVRGCIFLFFIFPCMFKSSNLVITAGSWTKQEMSSSSSTQS